MDPKNTDKKADSSISRRQMLQRLGGFSLVAAGVLAASPCRSEAGPIAPILSLLLDEKGPVYEPFYEDFESGWGSPPWYYFGDLSWAIVCNESYQGSCSAQSGAITHGQLTGLVVFQDLIEDGFISFYRRVSSEAGWDKLWFGMDGTWMENWSGEVAWDKEKYPVTAGSRYFHWAYVKDGSASAGSDCAWIDEVRFEKQPPYSDYSEWSNYGDTWSNSWSNSSDYGVWGAWMESW